jgi:RimJ/RimL family protein N-acetyltransferase
MRQARYRHGKYGDELIMSILRSEWDAANKLEE